ncbi:hypothetical protein HDU96_011018 [Phlyctochytrium bullatum]|nr:hypothetical protein HDU96_011018 [Phlyctochytrium bullatum]
MVGPENDDRGDGPALLPPLPAPLPNALDSMSEKNENAPPLPPPPAPPTTATPLLPDPALPTLLVDEDDSDGAMLGGTSLAGSGEMRVDTGWWCSAPVEADGPSNGGESGGVSGLLEASTPIDDDEDDDDVRPNPTPKNDTVERRVNPPAPAPGSPGPIPAAAPTPAPAAPPAAAPLDHQDAHELAGTAAGRAAISLSRYSSKLTRSCTAIKNLSSTSPGASPPTCFTDPIDATDAPLDITIPVPPVVVAADALRVLICDNVEDRFSFFISALVMPPPPPPPRDATAAAADAANIPASTIGDAGDALVAPPTVVDPAPPAAGGAAVAVVNVNAVVAATTAAAGGTNPCDDADVLNGDVGRFRGGTVAGTTLNAGSISSCPDKLLPVVTGAPPPPPAPPCCCNRYWWYAPAPYCELARFDVAAPPPPTPEATPDGTLVADEMDPIDVYFLGRGGGGPMFPACPAPPADGVVVAEEIDPIDVYRLGPGLPGPGPGPAAAGFVATTGVGGVTKLVVTSLKKSNVADWPSGDRGDTTASDLPMLPNPNDPAGSVKLGLLPVAAAGAASPPLAMAVYALAHVESANLEFDELLESLADQLLSSSSASSSPPTTVPSPANPLLTPVTFSDSPFRPAAAFAAALRCVARYRSKSNPSSSSSSSRSSSISLISPSCITGELISLASPVPCSDVTAGYFCAAGPPNDGADNPTKSAEANRSGASRGFLSGSSVVDSVDSSADAETTARLGDAGRGLGTAAAEAGDSAPAGIRASWRDRDRPEAISDGGDGSVPAVGEVAAPALNGGARRVVVVSPARGVRAPPAAPSVDEVGVKPPRAACGRSPAMAVASSGVGVGVVPAAETTELGRGGTTIVDSGDADSGVAAKSRTCGG